MSQTSSKPKRGKTPKTENASRKQQELLDRQRIATARLRLWLDWTIPSVNTSRYKHWRVAHLQKQGAKRAWLSALKLSAMECEHLMRIISSLAPNPSEMLSREASVLTMLTNEFAGDIARSSQNAQPEPLSV